MYDVSVQEFDAVVFGKDAKAGHGVVFGHGEAVAGRRCVSVAVAMVMTTVSTSFVVVSLRGFFSIDILQL